MPKKPPPEAMAALVEYTKREQEARERKSPAELQSVRAFLDTYRSLYATAMEPLSLVELDKAIKLFVDWCEENKVTRMDQIDSAACHRWVSHRARTTTVRTGKPIQHATLKKERALLAAAWSQAMMRREIKENPWATVPVPGKPTQKTRYAWSVEEYQKLLAVCRPWLRDLLILGCHTGLRIKALRSLEWGDIAWAAAGEKGFGWVVVPPRLDKAKKGYRVPMSETLHDMLARRLLHRDPSIDHIVTGQGKRPIRTSSNSDTAIRRACRRAELKNPDSPNHHMRRTFGRWAVFGQLTGKPVPLYVVSRWLGHATVAMTLKYLDIRDDDSTRFMLGEDDDTPK